MKNYKNILNFSQRRQIMKKSLLFLFVFVMLCLPAMAQPDKLSIIKTNTSLVINQRYYSDNKKYALVCQKAGNLVLYKFSRPESYSPIWWTSTHSNPFNVSCIFQADGNLVLYAKYKNEQKAIWNSRGDSKRKEDGAKHWTDKLPPYGIDSETHGSSMKADAYWMHIRNDGNLMIHAAPYPGRNLIWESETSDTER